MNTQQLKLLLVLLILMLLGCTAFYFIRVRPVKPTVVLNENRLMAPFPPEIISSTTEAVSAPVISFFGDVLSLPILVITGNNVWVIKGKESISLLKPKEGIIGGYSLNAKTKNIAMWHWEEDNARYYRSSLTGVYLLDYNGNSYSISDIIKSGNVSHTNIEISPNGKYLSYSIEDGASFGVYDLKENKELFKMPETEGVRYGKVVWLDDENFSYIYDGFIYVGDIDNPQRSIVTSDAKTDLYQFESPPYLLAPIWSKDRKYVAYQDTRIKKEVLLDVINNKKYFFGSVLPQEMDEMGSDDYLNVNVIGWQNDDTLAFTENSQFRLAKIENNELYVIERDLSYDKFTDYTPVNDTSLVVSEYGGKSKIYDVPNDKRLCEEIDFGAYVKYYKTKDLFYFVTDDNQYAEDRHLSVYDINRCKKILEIKLEKNAYLETLFLE